MKRSVKETIIRLVLLVIGLTVAQIGITFFVLVELGSDPFTTMCQGIGILTGIELSHILIAATVILTVLMFFTTKGYVKIGTIVCAICGGLVVAATQAILGGYINGDLPMWGRVVSALAGCVILAAGMTLVITSDAGTGSNDLVAVILTDKLKNGQFRWVRMACDGCFLIVGVLLKGDWGVGTLIAVFLVGPTAQFFMAKNQKIVDTTLAKFGISPVKQP